MNPGDRCTINNDGEIAQNAPCSDFIGQPCEVVKRTKAGFIMVRLIRNPKRTMSFSPRNVDLIE